MLGNLGSTEIIVVALVLLLLFGGKKLPEFARGLGEATKEFNKAKKDIQKAMDESSK